MHKENLSRYGIVCALLLGATACTDANFNCGSEPVRHQLLEASKERFAAKLVLEYAAEDSIDLRDPLERARADASSIEIATTRKVRKNYLDKELLCTARVRTPGEADISVAYVIQKVGEKIQVSLR